MMSKAEYKLSAEFKAAVRSLWMRIIPLCIFVAVAIGWWFNDIIQALRTPIVKSSLGEFMLIFMVVYVFANIGLRWLSIRT